MFNCADYCQKAIMNRSTLKSRDEESLFYAIENNDVTALQKLIRLKVDVNHIFYDGPLSKSYWTPLHICCERGRYEVCETLLEAGANPNIQDKHGLTPLMYAASSGWYNLMELLLAHGAETSLKDVFGATVAHVAASCDDKRIIQVLVKAEVDLTRRDTAGRTPLWIAASHSVSADIVASILRNVGNDVINARDNRRERNALQAAILQTYQDLYKKVEVLVNNGADIYNMDLRFHTPPMNILQRWYEGLAKQDLTPDLKNDLIRSFCFLLNNGYNVNSVTAGQRPNDHDGAVLHLAARLGLDEAVRIIVDCGGNVDQMNTKGLTPIHLAARYWHIEVAKVLIENGCNLSAVSSFTFGRKSYCGTAFRLALESGGLDTALFLVDAGYDLHVETYLLDEIDIPDILCKQTEYFEYLKGVKMDSDNKYPDRLVTVCFKLIRYLFGSKLKQNVQLLPLPKYLKEAICFQHFSA